MSGSGKLNNVDNFSSNNENIQNINLHIIIEKTRQVMDKHTKLMEERSANKKAKDDGNSVDLLLQYVEEMKQRNDHLHKAIGFEEIVAESIEIVEEREEEESFYHANHMIRLEEEKEQIQRELFEMHQALLEEERGLEKAARESRKLSVVMDSLSLRQRK